MPFTFAHPAAVLWCTRWRGAESLLAALVVGSMSPDFEYFLRLRVNAAYGHSFPGIVLFCIPVGFAVYLLYQGFISGPLTQNLPVGFRARLAGVTGPIPERTGPMRLVAIAVALGFGALTHILWDGFTHSNGMIVSRIPLFAHECWGIPVYKFLQHGSTLIGFTIIAYWFYRRPGGAVPADPAPSLRYWVVVAIGWVFWFVMLNTWGPKPGPVTWLLAGINALFLGFLGPGLWMRWMKRRTAKTQNLAV